MADFMDKYIGMFREGGIIVMYFDRRIRDDTMVQMNNGYHVRSVLYYIRTERVTFDVTGPIKRIDLGVSVTDVQNLSARLNEQAVDLNLKNSIINRWINKTQNGG